MREFKKLIMVNQEMGPMFIDLIHKFNGHFANGLNVVTGNSKNFEYAFKKYQKNLTISKTIPLYRKSMFTRSASWIVFLIQLIPKILFCKKTDLFLITSNPPILGFLLAVISFFKKVNYVYLIYDFYPDVILELRILREDNLIIKFWNWTNINLFKNALLIFTLTEQVNNKLRMFYGIKDSKIKLIPPWADNKFLFPISGKNNPLQKRFNPDNKKIVLYSGNMGKTHNIKIILNAASKLSNNSEILFLFVGGGDKADMIKEFIKKTKLKNLKIENYVKSKEFNFLLNLATLSIASVSKSADLSLIPSKIFSYMSVGLPLIAIGSQGGVLENVIEKCNCGVFHSSSSSKDLAEKIENLINNKESLIKYKKGGTRFISLNHNKIVNTTNFLNELKKIS